MEGFDQKIFTRDSSSKGGHILPRRGEGEITMCFQWCRLSQHLRRQITDGLLRLGLSVSRKSIMESDESSLKGVKNEI